MRVSADPLTFLSDPLAFPSAFQSAPRAFLPEMFLSDPHIFLSDRASWFRIRVRLCPIRTHIWCASDVRNPEVLAEGADVGFLRRDSSSSKREGERVSEGE